MKKHTMDILLMPILFTGFIGLIKPEITISQFIFLFLLLLMFSIIVYTLLELVLYKNDIFNIKSKKLVVGLVFIILGILNIILDFQLNALITGIITAFGFILVFEEKHA